MSKSIFADSFKSELLPRTVSHKKCFRGPLISILQQSTL